MSEDPAAPEEVGSRSPKGTVPESTRDTAGRPVAWLLLAGILLGAGVFSLYGEVWWTDPARFLPAATEVPWPLSEFGGGEESKGLDVADYRMVIARVIGNARAIAYAPSQLFARAQCYPLENALIVADPMLASGLLAVPGVFVSSDPLVAFNSYLVLMALFSGAAMCALVWKWSGVPAAGIVAGLIYALHPYKVGNVSHAFIFDTVWTVLALFFAQRLFDRGRIVDGLALGLCCVLQMAEGFYAFLGAVLLAIPVSVWLVVRRGGLPAWPGLATALGVIGLGAIGIFFPFLGGAGEHRSVFQAYAVWQHLVPWHVVGMFGAVFVAVALVAPRRFCLADVRTDPRWALVLGALLIAVIAAGGNLRSAVAIDLMGKGGPAAWPDPYAFLAAYIPGLSQVRVPANIWVTGQVALAILAGLGAAACVRWAPRRIRTWVAVLLTLIVWTSTLRPSWLGLSPRAPFALLEMRPSADALNFYDRLSELGNAGPLFEFPLGQAALPAMSQQVLLTVYHGRRTSGCYASVLPAETVSVRELATRLVPRPSTGTLGELRELGFSTIVVHHGGARGKGSITARLDRLASGEAAPFRPLHETPGRSAYRIVPAPR